jgi:cytochrome c oxidase cbb3-type subunit 2
VKGLLSLFVGLFGTFAFSWVGLSVIPNWQIGHLDPQMDEEGGDAYPKPKSGLADRGRRVFTANGCYYCHSEQIRPDYAGSDLDRTRDYGPDPRPKWGERRSAPRDYIFERPTLLGKMRVGPDLANMGKAAPAEDENAAAAASPAPSLSPGGSPAPAAAGSPAPAPSPAKAPAASPSPANSPAAAASPATAQASPSSKPKTDEYSSEWHHRHLYSPRGINPDSNMPAYRFLYDKRRISGEPSVNALKLRRADAPPEGWEIVPSYDAECLVAYLMSLDQSHPLKEVKPSSAPAAAPAASPAAASASPAPAAAAPKK